MTALIGMKAYLVDPFGRSITEVGHGGQLTDIYAAIDASCFDLASLDVVGRNRLVAYVDDNGYYRQPQAWWTYLGYHYPLAGKGLVLGVDEDGNSIAAGLTLRVFEERVTFHGDQKPLEPKVQVITPGGVAEYRFDGPDGISSADDFYRRIFGEN